jgi:hypothetical protein
MFKNISVTARSLGRTHKAYFHIGRNIHQKSMWVEWKVVATLLFNVWPFAHHTAYRPWFRCMLSVSHNSDLRQICEVGTMLLDQNRDGMWSQCKTVGVVCWKHVATMSYCPNLLHSARKPVNRVGMLVRIINVHDDPPPWISICTSKSNF